MSTPTANQQQAHEFVGDPRGACGVCIFSIYHSNHNTPAEGKSRQCEQGRHGLCVGMACICLHHLTHRLASDTPAAIDYSCHVCGVQCDLAPDPPARAVCPEHCEDHNYAHDPSRAAKFCQHCDQEEPEDWR